MSVSRRGVVKGGAAGALSIALAGSLDTIFQTAAGADAGEAYGYGPLVPDPKGQLDLPKGFSYTTISAQGDTITDGVLVPGKHDGAATFKGPRPGVTRLVRNHEQTASGVKPVAPSRLVYDPAAYGGTTTPSRRPIRRWAGSRIRPGLRIGRPCACTAPSTAFGGSPPPLRGGGSRSRH